VEHPHVTHKDARTRLTTINQIPARNLAAGDEGC